MIQSCHSFLSLLKGSETRQHKTNDITNIRNILVYWRMELSILIEVIIYSFANLYSPLF
jgi:hypothetical protein